MVGYCISAQAYARLMGYLLHDLGLPDPRRSHQQDRSLPDRRYRVISELILREISLYRIRNLGFSLFDIHIFPFRALLSSSPVRLTFSAQGGTLISKAPSSGIIKAVS